MRRRRHLPETTKTVAKPAKQGLQPLFAVLWIWVSKGLLRNLYWQIAQKKYRKFLFVQWR